MAKYESQYKELSFVVGTKLVSFNDGVYETEDNDEIEVLSNIEHAVLIEEKPKQKKAR